MSDAALIAREEARVQQYLDVGYSAAQILRCPLKPCPCDKALLHGQGYVRDCAMAVA